MSFVSYSQNFEDVMLWRALKHISNGFYIDVGANDPITDSITKAFYDRGWNGINIEPLQSHYQELLQARPRDINLNYAAGTGGGLIELWECDIRGWATSSPEVIEQHEKEGYKGSYHKVPIKSLTNICAQHVNSDIHFLKIDVEGFEKSVLESMDFSLYRPWILLIEATKPNSREENYSTWESLVLNSGYVFSYSDGINRYYVADERQELLPAFKYPPNVFDTFISSDQFNIDQRAQKAELKLQETELKLHNSELNFHKLELSFHQLNLKLQQSELNLKYHINQIQSIYSSSSWKVTRPLRGFKRLIKGDASVFSQLNTDVKIKVKSFLRPKIIGIINKINSNNKASNLSRRILNHFPWLKSRLVRIYTNTQYIGVNQKKILGHEYMSSREKQVFQNIQQAIDKNK